MQARLDHHTPLPPGRLPRELWPDVSGLVIEDGPPVNWYQERQMRLLGDTLTLSWKGPGSDRKFLAGTDIGVYDNNQSARVVPDVVLGLDIDVGAEYWSSAQGRSWFNWVLGAPYLVMEIVSNNQERCKLDDCARLGIRYVIIWDPWQLLSKRRLRIYRLGSGKYCLVRDRWLPELGLGLTTWTGRFMNMHQTWLRWHDKSGQLLASAEDTALIAKQETTRADAAAAKAAEAMASAAQAMSSATQARAMAAEASAEAAAERLRADHERAAGRLEVARRMLAAGMDEETVLKLTRLSADDLRGPSA